jgi:hypothetical protein
MKNVIVALALAALALAFASSARADTLLTGAYDTGDGSDGNQTTPLNSTGPWTLTATNSTFSYLLRYVNENVTFSQLSNLNSVFNATQGGSGGGSPRLRVLLDYDNDNSISAGDRSMSIYLGDSPSYINSMAVLNSYSGFNVIGNNDPGRYDTSAFVGGSPATTYSAADALLGGYRVLRLGYVVDTFGPYGDRTINVESISAAAAPLPVAAWAGMTLIGGLGGVRGVRGLRRLRRDPAKV